MEIFTTKVKTNLDGVLQMTQMIDGIMMTGDNAANQILVELYRGIDRVTIDPETKIVGYFIRSDGETMEIDGSVENNMAKVVIPEAAYQVSGNLSIAIRMFDDPYTAVYRGYYDENNMFIQVTDESQTEGPHGEQIVTKEFEAWKTKIVIATLNCYVQITETDSIIDVYHHIPDVQELLAYIETLDNRREVIEQEETARAIAENSRVQAENARVSAEQSRQTNYNTKMTEWTQAETTRQSTFESNEAARVQTFTDNESARQDEFDQNETARGQTFTDNETARQTAFDTAETARQQNEETRIQNESGRATAETLREQAEKGPNLDGLGGRVKAEADRVAAENLRVEAQNARNAKIDNMTVEAQELNPYDSPTATITEVNGHKHIVFGLAPGDPFVIAKIFSSVSDMTLYAGEDLRQGQFVLISSDTEDPDNAKMYVVATAKPVSATNTFTFVTDLSGAQGIQGPRGYTGNGISSTYLDPTNYTLTVTFTDGDSYTTESIRGLPGATGNGIAGVELLSDYKLKITFTDGTTYTTDRPVRGVQGDPGNGIASATMGSDYKLTITMTDGSTFVSPSLKGEPGAGGTNFTYDSTDKSLVVEFY